MNGILVAQAVAAPLICAALCLYAWRQRIGGEFLLLWALGMVTGAVGIALSAIFEAPRTTVESFSVTWSLVTIGISSSGLFFLFGVLLLDGIKIPFRRIITLTLLISVSLAAISQINDTLLHTTVMGSNGAFMLMSGVVLIMRRKSAFYIFAGLVAFVRAANSVIYIYLVMQADTFAVPELTYATSVFVNLAMGLSLVLIAFDNSQSELRVSRDAARDAKNLTDALYQENASILRALDAAQERIIIEDAMGRVRYVNQAVANTWGSGAKSEIVGLHFNEAFPLLAKSRAEIEEDVLEALADGKVWTGELLLTRRTGDVVCINTRVMQLPDNGKLLTAEDVTEQRKQAQREEQLKSQLAEAQKMEAIGRLAGGVAHDFNNIIAAVRAFASLITDKSPNDTIVHTYSNRITQTCDRAADLVRQILLFSRATQAELKPLHVYTVVDEVAYYLKASIPDNIQLEILTPDRAATIQGNAGQLIQVLMNLALNSRDAIGDKAGHIRITSEELTLSGADVGHYKQGQTVLEAGYGDGTVLRQLVEGAALPDQRYLCLVVSDNGPGISAAVMGRLFEPFFTTKDKSKGTGLGLPVVAAVVAAHAGFIAVSSREGHGCQFSVFLPLTHQAVDQSAPMRRRFEEIKGSERVLLVDDEVDLADATSLLLTKFGYETAPLYCPKEALEIFNEDPSAWDVVITDQVMPEMQGLDLIKKIKAIRADIPIILCTGFSDFANERTAMEAGASAFFNKPVAPEDLALAIRKVCGGAKSAA